MCIGNQRHIVAQRNRAAASRIDTIFGHAPHDDEMADFVRLKFFRKPRLEERVGRLLSNNALFLHREDRRMYRPRRSACFEGMSLGTVMLHKQDGNSRRTGLPQQRLYIRQNPILKFGRHKPHQPNLKVDDH